jgi:hypothetical protein
MYWQITKKQTAVCIFLSTPMTTVPQPSAEDPVVHAAGTAMRKLSITSAPSDRRELIKSVQQMLATAATLRTLDEASLASILSFVPREQWKYLFPLLATTAKGTVWTGDIDDDENVDDMPPLERVVPSSYDRTSHCHGGMYHPPRSARSRPRRTRAMPPLERVEDDNDVADDNELMDGAMPPLEPLVNPTRVTAPIEENDGGNHRLPTTTDVEPLDDDMMNGVNHQTAPKNHTIANPSRQQSTRATPPAMNDDDTNGGNHQLAPKNHAIANPSLLTPVVKTPTQDVVPPTTQKPAFAFDDGLTML